MRRDTRPAGRAGFTLVELLIVIAILALLAALVAAGIGKVKDAQQARVTDQTLLKLQLAVDQQWKVICDKCHDDRRSYTLPVKNPDFVSMVTICDGDVDRAESLWMYLNLRRSMPHTFAEARADIIIAGNGKSVTLNSAGAFKQIKDKSTASGDAYTESAALLYLILTQGGRGTSFPIDDATQGAQTTIAFGPTLSLTAFRDSYGVPIAFRRFFQAPELDESPYTQSPKWKDPLDPYGKLKEWNTKTRTDAETVIFRSPAAPGGESATSFDGRNRVATVISAGPDSRNLVDAKKTAAFTTGVTDGEETTVEDNAYGYRLTRQGNKGG
ncbi:prepilin-type N-terminal cleavage/methylation domain-containing protein [bacterium]|nr:prepilin-type N-terminal cleavage/methylation domain-containing protein [bacterium]